MSARSTPRREEGSPRPIEDAPSRQHEAALPPELDRYTRTPVRWRPGCEVGLLVDGARTYHAMLDAIAKAERSILVETYTLAADTTGDRFKVALIARARAGVAVRILYDAVGSFALPDAWIADLRAAGVAVVEFNPIAPWRRRFNLSHRDHRKILVVDDEDLAVIAVREVEPAAPGRDRVELHDRDARRAQVGDPRVGERERADRVVEDAHGHARSSARDQGNLEAIAGGVRGEGVGLDQDRSLGLRDRVEHGVVGARAVHQQPHLAPRPPAHGGAGVAVELGRQRGLVLSRRRVLDRPW